MILVTGGAGYIGSHFVKFYLEQHPQESVVVVDNLTQGCRQSLVDANRIHFFEEDIGDIPAMQALMRQFPIRAVVHFAASCIVKESQENPTKYFRNNTVGTFHLLEAMESAGINKLVFSSTCATYGDPVRLPLDESHPQQPVSVYGLSKLMMEQALKAYCERLGWSVIALRYFNAAGSDDSGLIGERHQPETHLIPLILKAAKGELPCIEVFGNDYDTPDGTCIRDYIHVNDLAHAHCQALKRLSTQSGFEAFNLGTAQGASVKEVIEMCRQVTALDIPVQISARRSGDPAVLVADAQKAKTLLGWTPQYDLRRIVETAWCWEQNRRY